MIAKDLLRRADRLAFGRRLDIYPRTIANLLDNGYESLLDVGCGANSPIGNPGARIPVTVGVDAHDESIQRSRAAGVHGDHVRMDILGIAEHFGPASFDVVAALDVIEHLEKDEGLRLLQAMETVARRLVIVFTPNGFLVQSALDGNPWQVHRSGWLVADFEDRGYEVLGMNGWKPLRGEEWEPRVRPAALGHRLSALTQPLVTHRPCRAFQLLAVRAQDPRGRALRVSRGTRELPPPTASRADETGSSRWLLASRVPRGAARRRMPGLRTVALPIDDLGAQTLADLTLTLGRPYRLWLP